MLVAGNRLGRLLNEEQEVDQEVDQERGLLGTGLSI